MLYIFGYWLFRFLGRILFHLRIEGRENIPKGRAIIAPNHVSYWDPPLVGAALNRYDAFYIAKKELFRFPIFAFILKMVHAFPVERGKLDIFAFRKALRVLTEDRILVIFPEGGREKKGQLEPALPGISWLAHKTASPVVPTFVANTHRVWSLPTVTIRFGNPCSFPQRGREDATRSDYEAFASFVMEEIAKLDTEGQYANSQGVSTKCELSTVRK